MAKPVPPILWSPSAARIAGAEITQFAGDNRLPGDYVGLWRWSVEHLEDFWALVWERYQASDSGYDRVLDKRVMPGAQWFAGSSVNYAGRILTGKADATCALLHASETRELSLWTWEDLRREVAWIQAGLVQLGVVSGDRVAAVLPNIPETVAAFLATASLGAVWACASPEFGAQSIADRFGQIDPKVLLAADGYRYGGKDFSCDAKIKAVAEALPNTRVVRLGYLARSGWASGFGSATPLKTVPVPFDHPLWILFSSGTTGPPTNLR